MLGVGVWRATIREGALTIIDSGGRRHSFGDGTGPEVIIRLADRRTEMGLLMRPKLELGQAYMDGRLTLEQGTLYDMLTIGARAVINMESHPLYGVFNLGTQVVRHLHTFNPAPRARQNAEHHYSLSRQLYELFLDSDLQYSCAYYRSPDDSLEEAQRNKKRHIASKLQFDREDLEVLDVGSGWGGMALYLASAFGARVTGLTLSSEQLAVSRERAEAAGLSDRVKFVLSDYRETTESFDRIVSVGMFEHVGTSHYRAYFRKMSELLKPGGVALVHSIGRMEPPGATNPWLRRYIFPGGYTPALSEVVPAIEKTGLWLTDMEIMRLHYAQTLAHWRENFYRNQERIRELYDDRFCRMWDYYLTGCEIAFRYLRQMVFQVQIAHDQEDVPLNRDYITDFDREGPARRGQVRAAE